MGEVVEQRPKVRRRKPTPEFTWEDAATASLPVLACFLGGATHKWAEGIIVALLGVMLLFNPPRFSLGKAFNGVLVALLGCAAIAYLPASWFATPAWRQALVDDFGIAVAATVSPQPWVTTSCLLSFVAGLCWLYYVAGGDIEIRAARRQLRIFALGVVLLAGLSILLYLAKTALPFWHNQRNFGPFPNRNQTATVLGLASVIILACGHDELRRGKKGWIIWLLGMAVVIAAIVLNFSRAGILILVAGNGLYLAVLLVRTASVARIAIGISASLALLTVLLVFGGQTLERFNLRGGAGATVTNDFRWLIFRDTWELIRASPAVGIGLGNFQPIFAIFRDASFGQSTALHPESDWLWLWTEVGWPGVALVVIGAGLLIRQVFPFGEGTNQWFRTGALVGALLFALHGLVDVAGHRVGSAYAGLFLLGLAIKRPMPRVASHG
jgi:O-antigen ligase